jgi:hypothetical protein
VPNSAIARFFARPPETAAQWILLLLSAALPVCGYLEARFFENHGQGWIDLRPVLSFGAAWTAAIVLGIIGLWRRVRWIIPAFAVNLILLLSGITAPRFLNPEPILWGERGIYEFSVLADESLLVCGAEWVHLGPDAAFRESIHQSCGFADVVQPFADGRVVLGIYDRPMFGDRAGRFRFIESLPDDQRIVRGATSTPDGGSIIATVSIPGGGVRLSKYKADESLERFWALEAPGKNWSATPLAWSTVIYPDGSVATLWRDPNKVETSVIAWHEPDGRLRPDTVVRDFCVTCVNPQLKAGRDGRVYAIASGRGELALLRFSRDGRPDPSFHPETMALQEALKMVQSLAELPRGGILIGGQKRVVRLDDSGQLDGSFSCALENSAREMALQDDRFLVLDGDRLRRFHRDGSTDNSFHMPRLKTRIGMATTPAK